MSKRQNYDFEGFLTDQHRVRAASSGKNRRLPSGWTEAGVGAGSDLSKIYASGAIIFEWSAPVADPTKLCSSVPDGPELELNSHF